MAKFTRIYNAAYTVRSSRHGDALRRQQYAWEFANWFARELENCNDPEALIYAVADALTCSPDGVPWEQ